MLGHASAATTLDAYADLIDGDLDAAGARLNDAMLTDASYAVAIPQRAVAGTTQMLVPGPPARVRAS